MKNLRWRDIMPAKDREGREIVVLFVQGKGKSRKLVAPKSVGDYLERIRAISKATEPDDRVFTNITGKPAKTLYSSLIADLLNRSKFARRYAGRAALDVLLPAHVCHAPLAGTRLYYLNNPTYSARPNYNFYNIWAFLNDAPRNEAGSSNPATGTPTTNRQDSREDLYGFFLQDDWKAKSNLTLNFGIRYSYFGPLSSKENNLNAVVFGTGAATYTGLSIRQGGNLTQAQKGNFGPQFGFAEGNAISSSSGGHFSYDAFNQQVRATFREFSARMRSMSVRE